jgi:low affinity Fe/Cu permease
MKKLFDKFARVSTKIIGSENAFVLCLLSVLVWAAFGPVTHYSDTWQLVMNTSSTIVTTIIVILIQQSSNKDTLAIHIKLDEILRAIKDADDSLRNVEEKTEEELNVIKKNS